MPEWLRRIMDQLEALFFGYAAAFLKHQGVDCAMDEWPFNIADVPQQEGNHDCGVFACLYMELWAGHLPVEYKASWHKQPHVQEQRTRIAANLLLWEHNRRKDEIVEGAIKWHAKKEKEKGKRKRR
ncbi:unnamed protein product [Linum trigynum]|uniref:Ubiquitin-like protease family profile domain-containing protein n=1 Tax=Linum trigynum TaxID=586398 RepID=A0AAV2DXD7_9ROSI